MDGPREPMLSAKDKEGFDHLLRILRYPVLGSPKLDGIRAFNFGDTVYSRKLKPLPNRWLQELFGQEEFHGLDGEMIVGKPFHPNVMQATSSGVMSYDGKPDLTFWVFDDFSSKGGFEQRLENARKRVDPFKEVGMRFVRHELLRNADEVRDYEEKALKIGYEGIMLRAPSGPYKHGRSTMNEGWLIKSKRFEDFEAQIVQVHELMHNDNPAETNELGRTKRSSAKANKRGGDTLGGFTCRTREGVEFRVGSGEGVTSELRAALWEMRALLPGKWVTLVKLPHGEKDRPRHPLFTPNSFKLMVKAIRDEMDL